MSQRLISLKDYRPLIGDEAFERIRSKAAALSGLRVLNFSSTYYGGGVAELLSSLTLLMSSLGIQAEWRIIQGSPDFFSVTKRMHNALQGAKLNFSKIKRQIYEEVIFENAVRNQISRDFVIVHDPQPLALIEHYKKKCPWIWRCHIELSEPHPKLWNYLKHWVDQYDAIILSSKEYAQTVKPPLRYFMPAINPFSIKNRPLSEQEMTQRLAHYKIPTDLPIVAQISRFDPWKDPEGVIQAFKLVQRENPNCRLVLLGNFATDDPQGARIFESLCACRQKNIIISASGDDTALVNTLQTKAAVVLQKSIREGFGLTVAEAMWKGTPVIGSNVGGIRHQITNECNGFLVTSIEETAERIIELLHSPQMRKQVGQNGHDTVRKHFLLTRYLEQYLDLFASFETIFRLRKGGSL